MINPSIYREYDIRGIYGKDFQDDFAKNLASALILHYCNVYQKKHISNNCSHISKKSLHEAKEGNSHKRKSLITISVGHDARWSSPLLYKNFIDGIKKIKNNEFLLKKKLYPYLDQYLQKGSKILEQEDLPLVVLKTMGLISSPMSYFSSFTHGANISVMITASHNPPEYNGFKISFEKQNLTAQDLQCIRQILDCPKKSVSNNSKFLKSKKNIVQTKDIHQQLFSTYIEQYTNDFHHIKPLPLVLDCSNGMAGCVARKLYNALGLEPIILFETPDGTFPNHEPDPTNVKNLTKLKQTVLQTQAELGLGFDGDADRIGVIDDKGNMVYSDQLIALFSRFILKEHPRSKIIGDVKCSHLMYQEIKKHGGQPIMWKTGHSLIKAKVKEENAPLGGELSGHIFFADRHFGFDDGLYAGLRLIELISKSGKKLSELLRDYPQSYKTPELRIPMNERKRDPLIKSLIKKYSNLQNYTSYLTDGLRIESETGWALIRVSHTQPVIVVRCESTNKDELDYLVEKLSQDIQFDIASYLENESVDNFNKE